MKQKIVLRIFAASLISAVGMIIAAMIFGKNISMLIMSATLIAGIWLAMALYMTKKIVAPIDNLADDIETGTLDGRGGIYRELVPFVAQIRSQKSFISEQINAIQDEKDRFSSIIEYMREGLIVVDSHKKILVMNKSASKYLAFNGNPEGRALVEVCRDINLNDAVTSAIAGNNRSVNSNRSGVSLQILVSPVFHQNAISGAVCMILDVTEKTQIDKIKQEFTANVSHELKTPLTTILGYAEMIKSGMAKAPDVPVFAGTIHREAERMLALISDILRLSELDESASSVVFESVDLFDTAQKCIESLEASFEKHGIKCELLGESSSIQGDPQMLFELVYNLCDNAIRYNKPNGSVTVTVHEKTLTVADTGIGIPDDCKARIFERFFRVDKSRSKETGGTGLGLAIVKHIAIGHNAEIELDSRDGEGTEITVKFD